MTILIILSLLLVILWLGLLSIAGKADEDAYRTYERQKEPSRKGHDR